MKPKSHLPGILLPIFMMILSTLACAQDCMGVTFDVSGYVVDSAGNPIEGASIRVWSEGNPGIGSPYELFASSDNAGYFITESRFSYGCVSFEIEITAPGYETKTLTYFPPAMGFEDELPPELTIRLNRPGN